ncbi:MAG: 50S ribosomal protein L9 [Pseudomonadota bacterium]
MSTQVILLERVDNLGEMGDVVSVKPGFARNFLLPQKKALRANEENVAYFESKKKHLQAENEKAKKEAEKIAKKLADLKAPLVRQASESGQLYGSVTSKDIADIVSEISKETVTRAMVNLNQNFKSLGLFPVEISLHPEVKVEVTINIARSQEEADIQAETGQALVADESSEQSLEEIKEEVLEDVLEEGALEAEKEKAEAEAAKEAEEAQKAAEKAAKKAEEDAAAAEAAEAANDAEAPAKEATEETSEEDNKE